MDPFFEENSPLRCQSLGVDCETCVSRSAREIAACCRSLGEQGIGQIFSSLYPSTGCAPMNAFFADVYLTAIRPAASAAAA